MQTVHRMLHMVGCLASTLLNFFDSNSYVQGRCSPTPCGLIADYQACALQKACITWGDKASKAAFWRGTSGGLMQSKSKL